MKAAAFALMIALLLSCREEAEIISGIEGEWKGTLAEVQFKPLGLPVPIRRDVPAFDTQIDFHKDGTMVVWENGDPRDGTYQLTGDELITNIDYSIEDISLAGTYTIETLTDTRLVMYTKRQETVADPDGGPSISGQVKVTLHFERG